MVKGLRTRVEVNKFDLKPSDMVFIQCVTGRDCILMEDLYPALPHPQSCLY